MKRPGSLVLVVAGVGAAAAAVLARVGVSRTTSRYVGETERNIDAVFDDAEASDVVLAVDDADELFDRASGIDDQDPD